MIFEHCVEENSDQFQPFEKFAGGAYDIEKLRNRTKVLVYFFTVCHVIT